MPGPGQPVKQLDRCGVCGGNNECVGCDGIAYKGNGQVAPIVDVNNFFVIFFSEYPNSFLLVFNRIVAFAVVQTNVIATKTIQAESWTIAVTADYRATSFGTRASVATACRIQALCMTSAACAKALARACLTVMASRGASVVMCATCVAATARRASSSTARLAALFRVS